MTEQMERYLRDTFAADAERAPVAHDLAEGARQHLHRQRRRRVTVTGAALGIGGVVVGVAVAVGTGTPAAPPGRGPASANSTTGVPTLEPNRTPALRFRGVEVPVPANMLAARNVRCGVAVVDAAYVVDAAQDVPGCSAAPPHPERLTEVVLQPWVLPESFDAPPTGSRVLADGRTQLVTRVPVGDVRLIVTSPDPDRAHRLFNGARVVLD